MPKYIQEVGELLLSDCYQTSLNYNPEATVDDGSCMYASEKAKRSLFVKFTGTWCWACGDYGAGVVKTIEQNYGEAVSVFEVHKSSSDPMTNVIGDDWTNYWAHSATPSFVANSDLLQGHPVAPASAIFSSFNVGIPAIAFHNEFTSTSGTISGTAYMQALEPLEGDYNLGIYIIGNGLVYKQIADDGSTYPDWEFDEATKTYPNYIHHNILHCEASNLSFGKPGFVGGAAQNETFKIEYNINPLSTWAPELEIVLIAWKKVGDKYELVNIANVSK